MAYTRQRSGKTASRDELRARIPGWGADLDPKDRPSVPKLQLQDVPGVAWEFPERQPERWPRERSIEHGMLPPVFGTTLPPRGPSGVIRRLAYRRYSEGRAAHWLLLLAADRVDAWEHHVRSFGTLRPDNPITETGVTSELSRHGLASRFGRRRADTAHQLLDPVVVGGPWLLAGAAVAVAAKALLRAPRRRAGGHAGSA
jgi:hypothetical protein